jgi:hypothetical protein
VTGSLTPGSIIDASGTNGNSGQYLSCLDGTRLAWSDPKIQATSDILESYFVVSTTNVDTGTDIITSSSHGLATGDALIYSNVTGSNLAPLVAGGTYYVKHEHVLFV